MNSLKLLSAKLRKALAQLPNLPRALGLVWQVARSWTIAWIVLLVVQGLLPVAVVYLTKLVVDGIVAALRTGGAWPDVHSGHDVMKSVPPRGSGWVSAWTLVTTY